MKITNVTKELKERVKLSTHIIDKGFNTENVHIFTVQ